MKFKLRVCKSLHACRNCEDNIQNGQRYYDSGINWRFHVSCFDGVVERGYIKIENVGEGGVEILSKVDTKQF